MVWYEVPLRIGLSVLCGFVIGVERERRHRPAGIKTHVLVCMGAALISLIQIYMTEEILSLIAADPSLSNSLKSDYGRLGAQVISGIGFLGAGTIMKTRGSIHGLTTASTVWLSACVGLAVGMGYYYISLVTLIFIVAVLFILQLFQRMVQKGKGAKKLEIIMRNKKETMKFIGEYCVFRGIVIEKIEYIPPTDEKDSGTPERKTDTYEYSLILPRNLSLNGVMMDLLLEDNILNVDKPVIL